MGEHAGFSVEETLDGWWSVRCVCGVALGARPGRSAAAELHAHHVGVVRRAVGGVGQGW